MMDLDVLSAFFFWGAAINLGVLLLSTLALVFARGWVWRLQSRMFPLREDHFNALVYGYLAVYKIVLIAFFVAPWVALQLLK